MTMLRVLACLALLIQLGTCLPHEIEPRRPPLITFRIWISKVPDCGGSPTWLEFNQDGLDSYEIKDQTGMSFKIDRPLQAHEQLDFSVARGLTDEGVSYFDRCAIWQRSYFAKDTHIVKNCQNIDRFTCLKRWNNWGLVGGP
ncbi:hypothetical protein BJY04DRAFT_219338 [Aspergillus karnatakaensis]|uniref:uncharacterized protein n=1 Tax=Aspergillus karnatakaensis TaxID=1810916 RepID=UPI003CCCD690